MVKVFGTWAVNFATAWNRFSMLNKDLAGKASCGNVHFPYNGTSDYNWGNTTYVNNRCNDWLNYPSTKGTIASSNCTPWSCNGYGYLKYWFNHLPYKSGTTNNKLNNWWAYVVDYDNAVSRSASDKDRRYSIESGANDYNTSCGTVTGANEVYLGVNTACSPVANYVAKFNFPSVQVAKGAVISGANLEFVVDGTYSNAITENITLTDGTTTTTPVSWPITATWTSQTLVSSPSLTAAVQQLVNSASWTTGKTITATLTHVSGTSPRRVFAFERESLAGARLLIK
jgi:hypothetical protein